MADTSVIDAIIAATKDDVRIQEAMLLGSDLESGLSKNEVGDHGTSFGPFQIHLPAHPGVSPTQAQDPTFAAKFMLPAYTSAVNAQGDSLWSTNPELAAEKAAVAAERPARSYIASAGQSTVDAKWNEIEGIIVRAGNGSYNPPPTNAQPGGSGSSSGDGGGLIGAVASIASTLVGFGNALDTIMKFIAKLFLPSTWARVFAFNVGVVLVLIGLWLFFSNPGSAAKAVGGAIK